MKRHVLSSVACEAEPAFNFLGTESAVGSRVNIDGEVVNLARQLLGFEERVGQDVHVVEVVEEI